MAKAKKTAKQRSTKPVVFTRFMLVIAVLLLWIGGIGARLVYLQVSQREWLSERAKSQRVDIKRSRLPRGTIFDRNGRILAMSVNVKTLYANPMEINDLPAAAKAVSRALSVNERQLLKQLKDAKESERKYVPIAKELDDIAVQRIDRALEVADLRKPETPKFPGLYWRQEQKRSYPQQRLASHVVGFSNADGIGQAGIEQSQNDLLYGAVVKKTQERDRLGRVYDETVSVQEPPKDIVLTIGTTIQYAVDSALQKAVIASGSKSGMAIVMDQKTGEILAMANYPNFDPNNLKEIGTENLTNRAVQSVYSPGSVFKLITYGSALEKQLIEPDAMIDASSGVVNVGGREFRDLHPVGTVSYAKALAVSSNVCAIKTGVRVGRDDFYATMAKLGMGRRTGIELPAETKGIIRPPAKLNGDSLASMSIGYEVGVSALQMVSAFATIANDGIRVQPHIIKQIRQSDGASAGSVVTPESAQVVSAETAADLKKMLREVVLSGTGKRAQLEGYSSAGKTGTAWKFDEVTKQVSSTKYISSFIGFAPAEKPAVTIAVVMDEPKLGGRDGGLVAAPVFHDIADQILPELGVQKDLPLEALTALADDAADAAPDDPRGTIPAAVVSPKQIINGVNAAEEKGATRKLPEKKDRQKPAAESLSPKPKATPPERRSAGIKNKSSA